MTKASGSGFNYFNRVIQDFTTSSPHSPPTVWISLSLQLWPTRKCILLQGTSISSLNKGRSEGCFSTLPDHAKLNVPRAVSWFISATQLSFIQSRSEALGHWRLHYHQDKNNEKRAKDFSRNEIVDFWSRPWSLQWREVSYLNSSLYKDIGVFLLNTHKRISFGDSSKSFTIVL